MDLKCVQKVPVDTSLGACNCPVPWYHWPTNFIFITCLSLLHAQVCEHEAINGYIKCTVKVREIFHCCWVYLLV